MFQFSTCFIQRFWIRECLNTLLYTRDYCKHLTSQLDLFLLIGQLIFYKMSYKSYDKIENQYFELHIESTWRKDYHLSDKSLQTDRITYETNQTQTNQSFYTNSNRLKDESLKNTQVMIVLTN